MTSRASMSPQPELQSCHGLSVLQSPVAAIVESTRYTFKKDGAAVNICRRVVIKSESVNLLDCRVNFQSLSSLNLLSYAQMYPERESRLPSMNYSELVQFLLHDLASRFFVFHERSATLEALRIALPRDNTIDLGRLILLRNDALSAGAKIWYQTRSHLTPLKDLCGPLLHRRYPENNLYEQGRNMIRLYQMIVRSLNPPALSGAVHTHVQRQLAIPHRLRARAFKIAVARTRSR